MMHSIRATVTEVRSDAVILGSADGGSFSVPRTFYPDATVGTEINLAVSDEPLMTMNNRSKEILNTLLKE